LVYRSTGICCYGDYHPGQVLYTDKDFVIIDFEEEPARPAPIIPLGSVFRVSEDGARRADPV